MISLITFNSVNFRVFGIPAYFFCAFTGLVLTTCFYIMFMSSKKYGISQSTKILFISLCGMALGAKGFGFLTGIYRNIGIGKPITLDALFDTGIVFYGGLFGLIITYSICLKSKRCNLDKQALDVLATCIPLFHTIARIGCFLSGCCYGKLYKGVFSINYVTTIDNQIDENLRFPVQLVEALFEFLLFIYLYSLSKSKEWRTKKLLLRYLALYSSGRFVLEFLRGDIRRGVVYGISFSQCISILIWVVLVVYYLNQHIISKKGGL